MMHCSDDDLVLHYYREPGADEEHLAACAACAARLRELTAVLGTIAVDVPPRDAGYGAEVWQRVEPALALPRTWWPSSPATRCVLAAAATIALVTAGYFAGRLSEKPAAVTTARALSQPADDEAPRRVLLLTVADHLERSDRVLTDIMNAPGGGDISAEQRWAEDLIEANRLYRQDAADSNESSVATVLDELERTLLDIVHRPADARPGELEEIRRRIDSAALLFKVRVMTNELRQQQLEPAAAPPTRSIPPIG